MDYLIDTQILIWFQVNDKQLKPSTYEILVNPENRIFVSDASLYEIAIKKNVNKLPELYATIEDIVEVATQDRFHFLPISHAHISKYNTVPLFENHRDPFDRLIIAVALFENFTIISSDDKFKMYRPELQLLEA